MKRSTAVKGRAVTHPAPKRTSEKTGAEMGRLMNVKAAGRRRDTKVKGK